MSSIVSIEPFVVSRILGGESEPVQRPNVADVGAWLSRAKTLRESVANYVPRHRAPGPAI
jgi:hypothetical protein